MRVDSLYSPMLRPFVLEVAGTVGDTGQANVQPDTLVYNTPGSYALYTNPFKHLRINNGTATLNVATVPGDLIASGTSGVVNIPSGVHTVTGKLRTTAGGKLQMLAAADTLVVQDSAVFDGGSTSGLLTAGLLTVRGNFVQGRSTSDSSFVAGGAHRVLLDGDAEQTIVFASPNYSRFFQLDVRKPAAASARRLWLLSNMSVVDSMIVGRYSEVVSSPAARLAVAGVLRVRNDGSMAALVRPAFVMLRQNPWVDVMTPDTVAFSPDTVLFYGSGGFTLASPTSALRYNNVRVATTGPVTWGCVSACDSIFGDLTLGGVGTYGTLEMGYSASLHIHGRLRTQGLGALKMVQDANLTVMDSVIFGGGDETGLLTAGGLHVWGPSFEQTGSTSTSFVGSGTFTVFLHGDLAQSVRFQNPNPSTGSRFQNLTFGGASSTPPGHRFLSSAFVSGMLSAPYPDSGRYWVRGPSGDSLVVLGNLQLSGVTLDSLRLVATLPMSAFPSLYDVWFNQYDSTLTEFYLEYPGYMSGVTFTNLKFNQTGVTGTGDSWHFVANDPDGPTPNILTVNLFNPTPVDAASGAKFTALGGATIVWPYIY